MDAPHFSSESMLCARWSVGRDGIGLAVRVEVWVGEGAIRFAPLGMKLKGVCQCVRV